MPPTWIYQQDNDPKRTGCRTKRRFLRKEVCDLDWPSQPPDLNPIENLWADVQRYVQAKKPDNLDELYPYIEKGWVPVSPDRCKRLGDSMSSRCRKLLRTLVTYSLLGLITTV